MSLVFDVQSRIIGKICLKDVHQETQIADNCSENNIPNEIFKITRKNTHFHFAFVIVRYTSKLIDWKISGQKFDVATRISLANIYYRWATFRKISIIPFNDNISRCFWNVVMGKLFINCFVFLFFFFNTKETRPRNNLQWFDVWVARLTYLFFFFSPRENARRIQKHDNKPDIAHPALNIETCQWYVKYHQIDYLWDQREKISFPVFFFSFFLFAS